MIELLYFKSQKRKKHDIILVGLFVLFIIILTLLLNKKTYDSFKTYGISKCDSRCYVIISLDYQKINIIKDSEIIIDNQEDSVKEYEYGEVYLNNNIPEQEIKIYTNDIEEKIVEVKINHNKQRIINRIKKIILER